MRFSNWSGGAEEPLPAPIAARRPAFLANRRLDVVKMNEALASMDFAAIQIVGHNCKGIGTGYGFPEISRIGAEIESAARILDLAEVEKLVLEFERCLPKDPSRSINDVADNVFAPPDPARLEFKPKKK